MKSTGITSKKELLEYQKQFKTDAAIGAQFGVSRQAIHQLRNKFGVEEASSAAKKYRNAKIESLYNNGGSVAQIKKVFKLSVSQIYRIIKY